VLPYVDGLWMDAEDSLALEAPRRRRDGAHARRRGRPPALDQQLHRRSTRSPRSRACACASRARRPTSSAPTSW
jgi:hypothetical protein